MRALPMTLVLCLLGTAALAYDPFDECDARLTAELTSEEQVGATTLLRFDIDVSSEEYCKVEYDLVVELMLPNGWTKKVRKTREVTLEHGASKDTIDVSMASELKMLGYETAVASCDPCSSEVAGQP